MKRLATGVFCTIAASLAGFSAFAGTPTSAGGFQPASSADAQYISNYGYRVVNSDSVANHGVVVDQGVWGPSSESFYPLLKNPGGTVTCWINYLSEKTGINYGNSNSTTATGLINGASLTFGVTSPTGLAAGNYFVSLTCSIPPSCELYGTN